MMVSKNAMLWIGCWKNNEDGIFKAGKIEDLKVAWGNNKTALSPDPYLTGDWYSKLKQPCIFNTVRIAGLSVEWPDGQDICPDCLYYESKLIKI